MFMFYFKIEKLDDLTLYSHTCTNIEVESIFASFCYLAVHKNQKKPLFWSSSAYVESSHTKLVYILIMFGISQLVNKFKIKEKLGLTLCLALMWRTNELHRLESCINR